MSRFWKFCVAGSLVKTPLFVNVPAKVVVVLVVLNVPLLTTLPVKVAGL